MGPKHCMNEMFYFYSSQISYSLVLKLSHLKYNDYESEGNKDTDYIINNYSKIEETNTSDLTIIGQPEDEYDCTKRRLGLVAIQLSSGYLQGSNIYKL
jgi:hypothetical protein